MLKSPQLTKQMFTFTSVIVLVSGANARENTSVVTVTDVAVETELDSDSAPWKKLKLLSVNVPVTGSAEESRTSRIQRHTRLGRELN